MDTIISSAIPTAVVLTLAYLAKDKLKSITESLASLVIELKELRKEMTEIAVLRVRVERLETECGELRERVYELEMQRRAAQ